MKSAIRFALLALVLVIVAMVSALTAMRFAIHGREVAVPPLVGLSPVEAERAVAGLGLQVSIERQYYSPQIPEGQNHVATATAGEQGAARVAGASGAESGTDAGNDSGCDGRERARGGIEYPAAWAGCGFDGAGAGSRHPSRSGAGAESHGERRAGGGTEDQLAGDDDSGARRRL